MVIVAAPAAAAAATVAADGNTLAYGGLGRGNISTRYHRTANILREPHELG